MKTESALVSVIIPNFNYAKYLVDAIESVLDQTYPSIEIIVVDDGSTDNSLEKASLFLDKITLISKVNGGVSSARNEGIKISKGEYVCFLDADDYWDPKKVELQMQKARDGRNGLVYTGYIECDSSLNPVSEVLPVFSGDCEVRFRNSPGSAIALLGTSTALIRRDILEKVGEFDLDLNTSADWDFLRRVSKFANFSFVPLPLVKYRRHSNNMSAGSLVGYYKDNEKAMKKMISEYSKTDLGNLLKNNYSKFKFYIGASSALFRSGNFKSGFMFFLKAWVGLVGL